MMMCVQVSRRHRLRQATGRSSRAGRARRQESEGVYQTCADRCSYDRRMFTWNLKTASVEVGESAAAATPDKQSSSRTGSAW